MIKSKTPMFRGTYFAPEIEVVRTNVVTAVCVGSQMKTETVETLGEDVEWEF